jgi:peptidoglycan/xylan/chitin deacetylase (PgdA/CDA1 family)
MLRGAVTVLLAAILVPLTPGTGAATPGESIGVVAPSYESPGGTVPAIVTVYGVPRGYRTELTARGTGGAVATCTGAVWANRRRHTASRTCYLRLPDRPGEYGLRVAATSTRAGAPALVRHGVVARLVRADGHRSPRPMSLARVRQVERCANPTDRVWLTFDDGGSPAQVRAILATLGREHVRGRFFVTGVWAAAHPTLLHRIRADGHLLADHTYSHPPLSLAGARQVARQVRAGVRPTTTPPLLRPPYGAGALTTRLESLTRGYRLCRWTVDSYDWQGATAARMAERIRYGDELTPPVRPGGVILLHGHGRYTASGLGRIIAAVRSAGLTLDPLVPVRPGPGWPDHRRRDLQLIAATVEGAAAAKP